MDRRPILQQLLENILGSRNVYFQPPESIKLEYPCIVYSRNNIDNTYANNGVYKQEFQYQIIVIDEDPDSEIVAKVSLIPCINHTNTYASDNLNHDVFTLFF